MVGTPYPPYTSGPPRHPRRAFCLCYDDRMPQYRRTVLPGATYFFTVVAYRRRPILCDEPVRGALRAAIATVRDRYPFTIDAWVLLPDHLHCLWTLPLGDADYSLRWNLIKRSVALACTGLYHRPDWMSPSKTKHRESTFWQRRYWEHCMHPFSPQVKQPSKLPNASGQT
jgi:putative transposase